MSLPIAIQVYSVRGDANADARGTLQKIKDMGYDGVEFAGFCNQTPADLKKICDEIGLVAISGHISMDAVLDVEKTVADYSVLGVKYLALAWLAEERRPGGPLWNETREALIAFATAAKKAGITFCYHNHDFEFEKIDGKYKLDIMYEEIPADLLQTELDTCWVNVGGENPADYIRKYSGRAPLVHLKDFVGSKSENMYELIGDDKAKAEATVQRWVFDILGLENEKAEATGGKDMVSPLVTMLLDMRLQAKADKNWALSDEIRDKLTAIGIRVKDRKDGVDWEIE